MQSKKLARSPDPYYRARLLAVEAWNLLHDISGLLRTAPDRWGDDEHHSVIDDVDVQLWTLQECLLQLSGYLSLNLVESAGVAEQNSRRLRTAAEVTSSTLDGLAMRLEDHGLGQLYRDALKAAGVAELLRRASNLISGLERGKDPVAIRRESAAIDILDLSEWVASRDSKQAERLAPLFLEFAEKLSREAEAGRYRLRLAPTVKDPA